MILFEELSKKNTTGKNKGKYFYYQDLFDLKTEFSKEVAKFIR